MKKIAVLGGGSWGTTLANLLAENAKLEVFLWIREKELLAEVKAKGENTWYLPGVKLHSNLRTSADITEVLMDANYFLVVVPCQYIRGVLQEVKDMFPVNPIVICASKGIEIESLSPLSKVINDVLSEKKPIYAILSGPSFAKEVSAKLPTAVSLGCINEKVGRDLQQLFSNSYFRVYYNPDYRGVELGGALKNIIALAAGIADGLGFGHDARAALITRGLAEMSRLGIALGAKERTFMGLSGMGDLVLTCTGDLSRNRQVGLRLGQGEKLKEIINSMRMVAEGVKTTKAVYRLAQSLNVEMPITEQVYAILYDNKDPRQAVCELMERKLKEE
ncbi:glycerol-3-phosphate dehydrogenase (NAD(P)+) [Desulfonauticus submarinus]|uniref:Glycerol-3-phosphate dehydrogenase [NAD(P)+] n=1 Tax=Desulfonauticus submarinus TaxID=206665 RepID=A0A1H0D6S6_9BACT|nr:NAD(P)H-dependent glycerol-3-phosphate dehydrogenase [Desulfonauticus submarinus]SDN65706.1 glycerol-3-phosphate dehydrogenase (NAD(P)+) [Desulfonauticus submarinus]